MDPHRTGAHHSDIASRGRGSKSASRGRGASSSFFNSLSGSIAYGRLRRIDYRSGLLFSATSTVGALIGANITELLSRGIFQTLFGITLILVSFYLLVRPQRYPNETATIPTQTFRRVIDTNGSVFTYSFSLIKGTAISFGVGVISGLLGIGGGIIHVPVLTQILGFPTHIATATSHFVVAITTWAAVMVHIVSGAFTEGVRRAAVLSVGAVIGAQFGARLSHRVSGAWIIRLLALGLALVGTRLLIAPL